MASSPIPDLPPLSPPSALESPQRSPVAPPAPILVPQTLDKDKNKDCNLEQLSKKDEQDTPETDFTQLVSSKQNTLKSECGVDAWKRWTKWRESQTNLEPVSSHVLTLKADLLRCSVAELSDCLLCFIREVKQSDGEPYSPNRLFYLCLSIQLFLFQNGRLENIFSDLIYDRFSTELTKILKPSVTGGGCVLSCVEEQFLWDCKQLGAYSPTVLLNTLLFFFCKYFGFTTVEQHRRLSFANITLCTKTSKSNTKTTFLRFHPPTCTNQEESGTKRLRGQMKFIYSKFPASLRQRSDLFYLQPDRSCLPSSPLWFSLAPLNDSSVEATIIRILAVRGLQEWAREGTCMAP
uniref:DUF3504 domain-containing protein n=1 Tax=Oreochromis aureus TaxID=47969 RepID=A0AAZ1XJS5_OREAU